MFLNSVRICTVRSLWSIDYTANCPPYFAKNRGHVILRVLILVLCKWACVIWVCSNRHLFSVIRQQVWHFITAHMLNRSLILAMLIFKVSDREASVTWTKWAADVYLSFKNMQKVSKTTLNNIIIVAAVEQMLGFWNVDVTLMPWHHIWDTVSKLE